MQKVKIQTIKAACSPNKTKTSFASDVSFSKLSAITFVGNPTNVTLGLRVNNIEVFPDDFPAQELVGGAFRPANQRETSLREFQLPAKGSQIDIFLTGNSASFDIILRYEND